MSTSQYIRAIDVNTGAIVIIAGVEREVCHTRKSRYEGFKQFQVRPVGDKSYSNVTAHDIRYADLIEVLQPSTTPVNKCVEVPYGSGTVKI